MLSNWVWEPLLQRIGKPYINFGKYRLFPFWVGWKKFKWHMDDEDRTIIAIHNTDWMFQFEDQLPVPLNKSIFIKKHQWHRLIKGKGSLVINIIKHE